MGPYCNQKQRFLNQPTFEAGHWFINEEGHLFIVPNDDAEIEGGDEEIVTKLNEVYRDHSFSKIDPNKIARIFNLEFVPEVYRHFDDTIGYFCC